MKTTWLKGCMPTMDLVSISHYFIDRLTIPELDKLKAMAIGLDSQTVPIGSTCSGLATAGICMKALFKAINQRFGTNVKVSCEFAVEVHPEKQKFILDAHGDEVRHAFENVNCFTQDQAFCLREKRVVPIPKVFLLVCSPSCVNLSNQRQDRAEFANCYEGGDCESAETYEYGCKQAVKKTEAQVSIYENVRDAASSLKDPQGKPCKPAVDVIADDARI